MGSQIIEIEDVAKAILFSSSVGEMAYYFSHLDQIEVLSMDNQMEYFLGFQWKVPSLAIRSISNKLNLLGEDDDLEDADLEVSEKAAEIALTVVENFRD